MRRRVIGRMNESSSFSFSAIPPTKMFQMWIKIFRYLVLFDFFSISREFFSQLYYISFGFLSVLFAVEIWFSMVHSRVVRKVLKVRFFLLYDFSRVCYFISVPLESFLR